MRGHVTAMANIAETANFDTVSAEVFKIRWGIDPVTTEIAKLASNAQISE